MRRFVFVLALAACGGDDGGDVARVELADMSVTPATKLDVLLLVDDTGADYQLALANAMPGLLAPLADAADVHIGVATSDLGTTGANSATPAPAIGTPGNGGCAASGRNGALTVGTASASELAGAFVVAGEGATANYIGALSDVVGDMVRVGAGGCGFEQHLRGVRAALDPLTNPDFRRPDAGLAVLVLGDEDDCSALEPMLMTTDTAALGPLQSFRCTRFGLTCDQDIAADGTKTGCRPADDSTLVESPRVTADFLAAQVTDPGKLAVAVIAGDSSPVTVEQVAATGGGPTFSAVASSCRYDSAAGGSLVAGANPGVRLASFAAMFASRGTSQTICTPDLADAASAAGALFRRTLGVTCVTDAIFDEDCVGQLVDGASVTEIPRCGDDHGLPCVDYGTDAFCSAGTAHVVLQNMPDDLAAGHVKLFCRSE